MKLKATVESIQEISIKSTAPDTEINALVAKYVAGWKFHKGTAPNYGGTYKVRGWTRSDGKFVTTDPDFLKNANSVMKLLDDYICRIYRIVGYEGFPETWEIDVFDGLNHGIFIDRNFCRAACFALLRAVGITIE